MNVTWEYTNKIVNSLIKINNAREIVKILEIPVFLEDEMKKEIIAKKVHYSTKIEGNTLKLNEVKEIISNNKKSHERNSLEVRNYFNALNFINEESEENNIVDKELIFKIHNLVEGKKADKKNIFRNGQNVVKNSETGNIIYLPPEAKDVDGFIDQIIEKFNSFDVADIPLPIRAGIFTYEFVTIHPFWDGNGRTSRLLANYILKSNNYDLKGFYVMEEFYDKDIEQYYNSLQMNLHHNFYFGRKDANITMWLEYFLEIMSETFDEVCKKVEAIYLENKNEINIIEMLDKRD